MKKYLQNKRSNQQINFWFNAQHGANVWKKGVKVQHTYTTKVLIGMHE